MYSFFSENLAADVRQSIVVSIGYDRGCHSTGIGWLKTQW